MEKYQKVGWPQDSHTHLFHYYQLPWPSEDMEDRSGAASKSHSQAEKRRRERINGHLSTLRRLIPRSDKMDKAALLGSVVSHVKELKRRAVEAGKVVTVPTDVDEVCVDYDEMSRDEKDCIMLKASVCCEDRPDLLTDLIQALKGLEVRAVKVDMATLGGRSINVMLLSGTNNNICLNSLKQSIKAVLSRVASLSMPSFSDFSSKRQRMLLPSNSSV